MKAKVTEATIDKYTAKLALLEEDVNGAAQVIGSLSAKMRKVIIAALADKVPYLDMTKAFFAGYEVKNVSSFRSMLSRARRTVEAGLNDGSISVEGVTKAVALTLVSGQKQDKGNNPPAPNVNHVLATAAKAAQEFARLSPDQLELIQTKLDFGSAENAVWFWDYFTQLANLEVTGHGSE